MILIVADRDPAQTGALAEQIYAQTWPYGFKAFYGYRNYALLDAGNRNYLAKANSVWALIEYADRKARCGFRRKSMWQAAMAWKKSWIWSTGRGRLKLPAETV